METQQGYAYHIKDDKKNPALYWMIPISSQVEKYKGVVHEIFIEQ